MERYPKYYWNKDKKLIAEFDWDGDINLYGLHDGAYYLASHNFMHDRYKLVSALDNDGTRTTVRDWEYTDDPWKYLA